MTSPTPGSALSGASVTFNWNAGSGASQYWLEVGRAAGTGDLFEASVGLATNQTVNGLPVMGTPVYVRLWTLVSGIWLYNDYTYTSFDARATMTSPAQGSVLSGASVTFNWNAGPGASQYWLEVGRSAGAGDLFEASVGLATSQLVNGLPVIGNPVYVRLWTLVGGTWLYRDYTYTAFDARAVMTSPVPGSALNASSVTFAWTPGTGATSYWLEVGTTLGSSNLSSQSVGLATSAPVSGLPLTSATIYVRLWTQLAAGWYFTDYTYTTIDAIAAMTSPTPGSLLVTSSVTFNWNAVSGATQYWLEIGTSPNDANLFFTQSTGTWTSINASVPTNGNPVYVRLWTLFGGIWRYADYTYQTIVFP
jgi:serine protease